MQYHAPIGAFCSYFLLLTIAMSKSLIEQTVREALQGFDRSKWTNKQLPAYVWVDSRRKALIEVPIWLYSEFGLNLAAMPDETLSKAVFHPPKSQRRAYRKSANEGLSTRKPQTGNRVTLELPKTSQIFKPSRGEQQQVKHISFVVPRHVSATKVAYFLWNCCDRAKLPYFFSVQSI